jgi:hypothetical protein
MGLWSGIGASTIHEILQAMNMENRLLIAEDLVEVQDFTNITDHVRRIFKIYLKLVKILKDHHMWPIQD